MKLVGKKTFNRPVGARLQLPYRQEDLAVCLTVMLLKNGQVELQGPVESEEHATKLLTLGLARLQAWHAKKRRQESSSLVGPDGQPITVPEAHA